MTEDAHSSGIKFESPNTYGIFCDEKLCDELMYELACQKREFSKGWIYDLAGKLARKRL